MNEASFTMATILIALPSIQRFLLLLLMGTLLFEKDEQYTRERVNMSLKTNKTISINFLTVGIYAPGDTNLTSNRWVCLSSNER